MHIAINGWFWDQPNTGSGQYVRRLLGALCRVAPDARFTLILPAHIAAPDDVPPDVQVVTMRSGRGKLGKVWFEQVIYPREVARCGADIAHVPYWGPPLHVSARLVVSILDVIPLVIPDYARGMAARLYTSLVTAASRGAAHALTLSEAAKADIVRHVGLAPEAITVTHLAADEVYHPRMGAERDAAVREKYDLPDRFVLYLGGFDVRKQVNQLLLAYTYVMQAEGEEVPLVLAGREPAWGTGVFPDLRGYAADLKLEPVVRWIGYVDEQDKPSLYRLADVFTFPTQYEGFGLMAVEAMQSGTPIVANDIPVMRELVGDAGYLVEPGNAREMAGAIIALLEQAPLRETQISRGLGQATRFSWRKTARETLAVYEQVMTLPLP